jgi:hypothetical protein
MNYCGWPASITIWASCIPGFSIVLRTERSQHRQVKMDVYNKLAAAETQIAEGKVLDGAPSLKSIKEK